MITSLANETIKSAIKLKQRKYRNKTGMFLVEGPHLVEAAITHGLVEVIFTLEPLHFAPDAMIVSSQVMMALSDVETPQGCLAVCRRPVKNTLGKRLLLLDGLQDPGNVGTLIRSAVAFGFTDVIAENSVDLFHPKVIRATQGALFHISWRDANLIDFIESHPGYRFYGTIPTHGQELGLTNEIPALLGIVVGNEGSGIRQELLDKTFRISIEMTNIESLNAGIAGSIAMYHFRQEEQ